MVELIQVMEWLAKTFTPVAQETVRQVAFRGGVEALVGIVVLGMGFRVTYLFVKRVKQTIEAEKDYDLLLSVVSGFFAFGLLLIGAIAFGEGLMDWLAPLPTVFGL